MASCDDVFSLLGNDQHHHHHNNHNAATSHLHNHPHHHHHQHPQFTPHRYLTKPSPIAQPVAGIVSDGSSPNKIPVRAEADAIDYASGNAGFCSHDVNPFSAESDPNPFEDDSDPNRIDNSQNDNKRTDRDELSDGGVSCNFKKPKRAACGVLGVGGGGGGDGSVVGNATSGGGEYRKDREEWSDSAIECLLEAYTEKYNQLNRGNLRGRDWEEVATIVSDRCENQAKTVEQCKNKVDNLKKRYKLERHRMTSGGILSSHWPWFKKMEAIAGNSLPGKAASEEGKFGSGAGGSSGRQQKRCNMAPASPLGQINNIKSKSMSTPRWQRVVFKISGSALAGSGPDNIDPKVSLLIAREVATACRMGVQVAIAVGGRNFFCGDAWINATGSDRYTAYQIGMMASVMNSLLLQSALEKMGVQTRVQTAFSLPEIGEPYNRQRAIRHLEKGRVVIFGGLGAGTGDSIFSTDVTAALRATDIHASAVLKGTNGNGVYDSNSGNNNITFEHISFRELASGAATSMDMMALTFCEENGIPVVVFNLLVPGNISRALCGEQVGTLIDETGMVS
ncbi:hypothetical protein Nepgr_025021 [Nepenthes gracilis]|uniref:UMP kinase n=1 Tax=Nepenthes gracilis TaxID=150966 RepID=A0AAD3T3Z5_NEPGR|nr:hypothetical protein Nepgr_025021 [Nepenthes gracilis]